MLHFILGHACYKAGSDAMKVRDRTAGVAPLTGSWCARMTCTQSPLSTTQTAYLARNVRLSWVTLWASVMASGVIWCHDFFYMQHRTTSEEVLVALRNAIAPLFSGGHFCGQLSFRSRTPEHHQKQTLRLPPRRNGDTHHHRTRGASVEIGAKGSCSPLSRYRPSVQPP